MKKKFVIPAETLKSALKKLSQAINKRSKLPVLENLYCKVGTNEVELITSDLQLTIFYTCKCETEGKPFEMLLPFDFLQKVVALAGDVPLVIEQKSATKAVIQGTNDQFETILFDKVEEFPKLPTVPKKNFIKLNGDFLHWLNKAMLTCGKDELKPAMMKACLDIVSNGMTIVSTDSHTLFTRSLKVESEVEDQLLISPKMAKALDGFVETEIYWHKQHIAFKCDNILVIATRHDEKFPAYRSVIPSHPRNLLLDRAAFIDALERCQLVNAGLGTKMLLKKEPGTIHLESRNDDLQRSAQVDIPGSFQGTIDCISFNPGNMLTLLNQVAYDKIWLHIDQPNKAIVLSAEDDPDYLALIMPLLVNE